MSKNNLSTAACTELKELNNVFIELTAKNCNIHCKNCYIDFPVNKNLKDFIPIDTIKQALRDLSEEKVQIIYLTGAEPMTHPDFNTVLRYCLKFFPVCICTNGSFLNEKKARFLKKVEDEGANEIIFMLPLAHFDEVKNDNMRSRGAFRQVTHAIKSLIKYNFSPILCVTNHYGEEENTIRAGVTDLCNRLGYELSPHHLKINPVYDKYHKSEGSGVFKNPDCKWGRVLSVNGIYVCPFLSCDHRGRSGSSFKDFGRKTYLETSFCDVCSKSKDKLFGL